MTCGFGRSDGYRSPEIRPKPDGKEARCCCIRCDTTIRSRRGPPGGLGSAFRQTALRRLRIGIHRANDGRQTRRGASEISCARRVGLGDRTCRRSIHAGSTPVRSPATYRSGCDKKNVGDRQGHDFRRLGSRESRAVGWGDRRAHAGGNMPWHDEELWDDAPLEIELEA